jgi:hypothetical protein
MFPYVCLATMPIFCNANWPRKILKMFSISESSVKDNDQNKEHVPSLPTEDSTAGKLIKQAYVTLNLW